MKKIILSTGFLISTTLHATTAEECRPKIGKARIFLVEMISGKKDKDQQTLVKRSADQATACVIEIKAPAGKEKQVEDLKKIWSEFIATRENDLVPKVLSGKMEEAKALTMGIQRERLYQINSLLDQLK